MSFAATNNPYFDGVSSAITTQGEVTLNCRAEHTEMSTRRVNMNRPGVRALSYGGGEVLDNLHIMPHEIVMGWINRQGRNQIPGHPNQIGFTSLNGIKWGAYSTNEELELSLRFIGLAKTPFKFEDSSQLKHGFTAIAVGSGSTFHTGERDIFPGDRLEWSVVPRPSRPGFGGNNPSLDGGRFGNDGPGSRQGNPTEGTPRGKLRFRINPSDYNNMKPSLNAAVSAMKKPMAQNGCSDRPFEHLFNQSVSRRPTPAVEFAMAQLYTDVVTGVRIIDILKDKGVNIVGLGQVELCDAIGIFETDPTKRGLVNDIINGLYMGARCNENASRVSKATFKAKVPGGFYRESLTRQANTSSRLAQVAMQLGNYQIVAYARAVHCVARRRFATALNYAKPGQTLDVLLGHFLESF